MNERDTERRETPSKGLFMSKQNSLVVRDANLRDSRLAYAC